MALEYQGAHVFEADPARLFDVIMASSPYEWHGSLWPWTASPSDDQELRVSAVNGFRMERVLLSIRSKILWQGSEVENGHGGAIVLSQDNVS
jgi:hypothetical protein